MSRLQGIFQRLEASSRRALIPYVVAGDPPGQTVALMHRLVAAGADILEIGVPFSDPMAEGPVIQLAHERALAAGMSLKQVLALVAEFRQTDDDTGVVLMGYANPVERMGYEQFAAAAAKAGVDGLLTVDIPMEEAAEVQPLLAKHGLDSVFLIAPTTSDVRLQATVEMATGYLYYVSLKGVTGAGNLDVDSVASYLQKIRACTALPVAVGFGIKDADSAKAVAQHADGVVVGSALVDRLARAGSGTDTEAIDQAVALLSSMRSAMDS